MPVLASHDEDNIEVNVTSTSYPARTKQAAAIIDGLHTDVMSIEFADRIVVTITQEGRLAQWVQVPLAASASTFTGMHVESQEENGFLPMAHLTPTTLLGGTVPQRETIGQLLAAQIASAIATKHPEDTRTVFLGLGLRKMESSRQVFFEVIDLVLRCL